MNDDVERAARGRRRTAFRDPRETVRTPAPRQPRVLVIAPHRDDETIGCGGALIRHADLGHHTAVAHLFTQGGASAGEARAAGDILGVQEIYDMGGSPVVMTPTEEHLEFLVRVIRAERPNIVYIPHKDDADPGHRVTSMAAQEARWMATDPLLFPEAGPPLRPGVFRHLLAYEVWNPMSQPAITCDITEQADRKVEALRAYGSQLEIVRWDSAALGLNAYRGEKKGVGRFAECFSPLMTPWPGIYLEAPTVENRGPQTGMSL